MMCEINKCQEKMLVYINSVASLVPQDKCLYYTDQRRRKGTFQDQDERRHCIARLTTITRKTMGAEQEETRNIT